MRAETSARAAARSLARVGEMGIFILLFVCIEVWGLSGVVELAGEVWASVIVNYGGRTCYVL